MCAPLLRLPKRVPITLPLLLRPRWHAEHAEHALPLEAAHAQRVLRAVVAVRCSAPPPHLCMEPLQCLSRLPHQQQTSPVQKRRLQVRLLLFRIRRRAALHMRLPLAAV